MKRRKWTEAEIETLRAHYPHMQTDELAELMGRNVKSVYYQAYRLGLHKSEAYRADWLQRCGKQLAQYESSRFQKGLVPWNAGLKGYRPGGRSEETQFQPGQLPHNTRHDGAVSIRQKEGEPPYKYIRVACGKWRPLHHVLWQEKHGKMPRGHILRCKTDDTLNCDPANWECISRAENVERNTIHRYPKEVKHLIKTLKRLNRQIEKTNEKQN